MSSLLSFEEFEALCGSDLCDASLSEEREEEEEEEEDKVVDIVEYDLDDEYWRNYVSFSKNLRKKNEEGGSSSDNRRKTTMNYGEKLYEEGRERMKSKEKEQLQYLREKEIDTEFKLKPQLNISQITTNDMRKSFLARMNDDAVRKKIEKEASYDKYLKEKAEKEMEQCTFHPDLSLSESTFHNYSILSVNRRTLHHEKLYNEAEKIRGNSQRIKEKLDTINYT